MGKLIYKIKSEISIFKMDLQTNYLYTQFVKWVLTKMGFVPVIAIVDQVTHFKMFLGIPWVYQHDAKAYQLRIVHHPESIHEPYNATSICRSQLD